VPNVKDVQNKSILEIAKDLDNLRNKAATNSLTNAELQGGTFTLSNVGNIGGTLLHPVLVTNEVCIGAIGKMQKLPRFEIVDGVEKVVSQEILNVSFNADHRVIDGATVAKFVQLWKSFLENPIMLSYNLK
jgi:2-oxoisovalerate dehydrogenase E2 component (dihydrolipoyl transacylase)